MTDYTPSGLPNVGRARSLDLRSEFADRIAPAINSKVNIASGAFTGTPTAPTASVGASGNQIATLDYVNATSFSTNLPGQTSNNGKVIVTDGSNASWTDTFTIPWTFDSTITANDTVTLADAINTARATVASHATTADIWGAAGNEIDFTGSETITDFPDAPQAGVSRVLHIAGAPTFTNNANIFLPNNIDYNAQPGDILIVHALTPSTFRCALHQINYLTVRSSPIFDLITLNKISVSLNDDISSQSVYTGLPGSINVVHGLETFVAFSGAGGSGFVATSADGLAYVLRPMPLSAAWRVGFDGTNFIASSGASPTMAKSSDAGVTWVPSTSLPGSAQSGPINAPVYCNGILLVHGNATTYYRSNNGGVSWTTETLPFSNIGGWFMSSGSNFIWSSTGETTYVSSTGLTGSWSSQSVPSGGLATSIWRNPDGSLGVQATGGTYRTINGIDWNNVVPKFLSDRSAFSGYRFYINNGITGIWSATIGESYTFHGNSAALRVSTLATGNNNKLSASDGAGNSVICSDSGYTILVNESLEGLFIL